MRSIVLAALLAALLLPTDASAKAWQGISPGVSTVDDVVNKFGEPTTRSKRATRTVLAYLGEQALPGTKQAQFHAREDGVILEITVFLATQLEKESIEGTYGKPSQRTFVEDTFQKVWVYPVAGVTVYFGKEGNVEALSFGPGTKPQPRGPAADKDAAPHAQPAAAR